MSPPARKKHIKPGIEIVGEGLRRRRRRRRRRKGDNNSSWCCALCVWERERPAFRACGVHTTRHKPVSLPHQKKKGALITHTWVESRHLGESPLRVCCVCSLHRVIQTTGEVFFRMVDLMTLVTDKKGCKSYRRQTKLSHISVYNTVVHGTWCKVF